ncbi:PepSY-like domain-containing protein [Siphonobacter aquaeclarae]|uniref:Putative beta-lactamase-inhibitor-like, PepSY-like n=1 Tax=Siphonobacter aquaeclarae TaxID=563176 RepID=A0A1G9M6L0_9BACT|nr:PepSY-like domain-containing protein [Siphonobacter aquaeclarae]SDL69910.1 Putative beta-lactamase-inhibitor-like, PepSY-like [Siphonobacter aquaeclarae]
MRKYLLLFLLFTGGLYLTSCTKDSSAVADSEDALDAVTATAARYSASVDSVTHKKCKGSLTDVDVSSLSATITSYIKQNYSSATIKIALKDQAGNTIVGIEADGQPKALLFDANGAFVQELQHYKKAARLTAVAVADLPAAISSYISANYSGATIQKAGKNAEGSYFVAISVSGSIKVLLFDSAGSFKQELPKPPSHKRH